MKYYIDYIDKSGDLCHVWLDADSESDAEHKVQGEYWDIDYIIGVRRSNG